MLVLAGGRGGVGSEKATTHQNEHTRLIFKGGGGGVGAKSPPSKTSIRDSFSKVEAVVVLTKSLHRRKRAYAACFRWWRWWWCWQRVHPQKRAAYELVF